MKRIIVCLLVICAALLASAQTSLRKSVTWQNIRSHPAPLPVVGELEPVHSSLDTESWWSVGSETLDRDFAVFDNYVSYMGETGVGYSRLQSGWAKTEKKKGKYDFSWIDSQVDGLIAQGIHPWICLCYGNPIYSDHGMDLNAKLFPDGPIMDAWLKYVKACVSRYKGKVTMYEVWNEPDGGSNADAYPLYANLFLKTAKVIRETDPDAKIAAFGVCSPDRKFIRQAMDIIKEQGGLHYIDYITFHTYWSNPETVIPAVNKLREDINAYSPSIGLLQGETGCPAQLEYGHAMHSIEWTEYSQAKWDLRQGLSHFGLGIPYSFFTMVDLNYGWMLQSYGLIRQNGQKVPVYKRPKFYAVQHVTSLFTPDMKAADGVLVSGPMKTQITSFGLEKGGKKIGCMLWISGDRPSSSLDRRCMDIGISGVEFKDPVYVDMLTGFVHDLKGLTLYNGDGRIGFKDLPLWDCPVVIVERTAVRIKDSVI